VRQSMSSLCHGLDVGSRLPARAFKALSLLSCAALLAVAGCSGNAGPNVGTISIVPVRGAIASSSTALVVNTAVQLSLTATGNATAGGIDWTVLCGGSPLTGSASGGACGSFAPAHTPSGVATMYSVPALVPLGTTVTLRGTLTGAPSVSSSVTLPVMPTSLLVTLASSASSVVEGGSLPLTLDLENDTTNAGVTLSASCSGTTCGTFTPATIKGSGIQSVVYNAPTTVPAGGLVTLTATANADTTHVATLTATILPVTVSTGPPSLSFGQQPTSVTTGASAVVSATVANDTTPGGVTWSVQCAAAAPTAPGVCGYVAPYQTNDGASANYIAPPVAPGVSVTVIATSTAFPTITKSSTPIAIVPSTQLSIRFAAPVPSQMQASSTVNVIAAVTNDATNAGVDYAVCGSCGYFTIKPAVPATATTVAVLPVTSTTTNTQLSPYWPNGWPNGLPIPYTAPVEPGSASIMANAHANDAISASAPITITSKNSGPTLNGAVFVGTTPLVGASVALYTAGTSGYGSASALIYAPGAGPYATTDSNGNFTISGGYGCAQSNTQVYLVAQGGHTGPNADNANLALMSALGSCKNLNSSPLVINEVTTAVSAAALAPFATDFVLTGSKSYLNIGTSSSNTIGLVNAFASVTNMVDLSTGQALFNVPAGNGTVPYVQINTFADILNACASTTGGVTGDGTPCGNLFSRTGGNTEVPAPVAPTTDTLEAAFEIAAHPNGNLGYAVDPSTLFTQLVKPGAPFQPAWTQPPNDLSLAIHYTGGGGLSSSSAANFLAIDASGDLWLTDSKNNTVIEWNTLGSALSPSTGYSAGGLSNPGPLAIDASGNVWVVSTNGLTELNFVGVPYPGSPFVGVSGGKDMALDATGNIWVTNSGSVSKFNSVGLQLSPNGGYVNSGLVDLSTIAVDSANNIWVGNSPNVTSFSIAELSNAGGQLIVNGHATNDPTQGQMVADGAGNIWVPSGPPGNNGLAMMPAYAGVASFESAAFYFGEGSGGSLRFVDMPQGIAIDGAGNAWVASASDSSTGITANMSEAVPSLLSTSSAPAFFNPDPAQPLRVAIDGSGNVWTLLSDNTVTEFVGIATPAVTPIALAANKRKLGAKP
jgi:hypothetical protein